MWSLSKDIMRRHHICNTCSTIFNMCRAPLSIYLQTSWVFLNLFLFASSWQDNILVFACLLLLLIMIFFYDCLFSFFLLLLSKFRLRWQSYLDLHCTSIFTIIFSFFLLFLWLQLTFLSSLFFFCSRFSGFTFMSLIFPLLWT